MMKNKDLIRRIAQRVHDAGGRALLVGGCVRDQLLQRSCFDVDCEVHGIAPDALRALLEAFGEIDESGREYGVFTIRGAGLDIALPRREVRTGPGHKDFLVTVDPALSPAQAAARRDFTVNAIMRDALTGEYVDPFGGIEDLQNGLLRAVPGGQFEEDPLRVLRGAQFAARFHLTPDFSVIEQMRRMPTDHLSGARVYGEMKKALLMADRPGVFFEVLRQSGALEPWFGELAALIGVEQNPLYHPEGDAWTHTLLVLDAAAQVRDQAREPLAFMLACLCHDLGKAVCTQMDESGNWVSDGHEKHSVPLARRMLERLGLARRDMVYVSSLCALHSDVHAAYFTNAQEAAVNCLLDQCVCPRDLCLLAVCDTRGTGKPAENADREKAYLMEKLCRYETAVAQPMPDARRLMAMGVAQGPALKEAIAFARRRVLCGDDAARAAQAAAEKYKENGTVRLDMLPIE